MNSLAQTQSMREIASILKAETCKEINDAHEERIRRIQGNLATATLGFKVLCWISYAYRPMQLRELQAALAIRPTDSAFDEQGIYPAELLLSACDGFVVVQQETQIIRFVHPSVRFYLFYTRHRLFPDAAATSPGPAFSISRFSGSLSRIVATVSDFKLAALNTFSSSTLLATVRNQRGCGREVRSTARTALCQSRWVLRAPRKCSAAIFLLLRREG